MYKNFNVAPSLLCIVLLGLADIDSIYQFTKIALEKNI